MIAVKESKVLDEKRSPRKPKKTVRIGAGSTDKVSGNVEKNQVPGRGLQGEGRVAESPSDITHTESLDSIAMNMSDTDVTDNEGSPDQADAVSEYSDDETEFVPTKRALKRWERGMKQGTMAQKLAARNRKSALKEAKEDKDGNKFYECDVCKETFKTRKENIAHHKEEHVDKKWFPCRLCGKVCHVKKSWLWHVTRVHDECPHGESHMCKDCGIVFPLARQLRIHQKTACKGRVLSIIRCKFCSKTFLHENLLEEHINSDHSEKVANIKCDRCDIWLSSQEELNIHAKIHENVNNQCKFCKLWFISEEEVFSHQESMHQRNNVVPKECQFCGKVFKRAYHYEQHIKLHIDTNLKKTFQCDVCQKECKTATTYARHKLMHLENKEKSFKCKYCGKGYTTKVGIMIHERTHEPEKRNFVCDTCGLAFKEKRFLAVSCLKNYVALMLIRYW